MHVQYSAVVIQTLYQISNQENEMLLQKNHDEERVEFHIMNVKLCRNILHVIFNILTT